MSDVIINVENLSKTFKLYNHPKDRLKEALNPFRKKYHHEFHALENLCFEIRRGDSVGILGKNGAGKSTLLKILTGVLTPTSGKVAVNGRIAALLELGSGFNPELSGMENIYFQGAIMGFNKDEMGKKVSEIIDFADIGEFIHQPVKTYSSGMFARLAFSISINVDPDILIVDEALSVGDSFFQHRCFQKLKSLKESGVTIILVSHSYQQIIENCTRALYLDKGRQIEYSKNVKNIVFKYEAESRNSELKDDFKKKLDGVDYYKFGSEEARFLDLEIQNEEGFKLTTIEAGQKIKMQFIIESTKDYSEVVLGVNLRTEKNLTVWGDNNIQAKKKLSLKKGLNRIVYIFDLNLRGGDYFIYCGLADIGNEYRVELDQRWPIGRLTVVSRRDMSNGFLWSPIKVEYEVMDYN